MVSHTSSPEARKRASIKFYANHRDQQLKAMRDNYYNNPDARLKKLEKAKQRVYVESTIIYIRRLFII